MSKSLHLKVVAADIGFAETKRHVLASGLSNYPTNPNSVGGKACFTGPTFVATSTIRTAGGKEYQSHTFAATYKQIPFQSEVGIDYRISFFRRISQVLRRISLLRRGISQMRRRISLLRRGIWQMRRHISLLRRGILLFPR